MVYVFYSRSLVNIADVSSVSPSSGQTHITSYWRKHTFNPYWLKSPFSAYSPTRKKSPVIFKTSFPVFTQRDLRKERPHALTPRAQTAIKDLKLKSQKLQPVTDKYIIFSPTFKMFLHNCFSFIAGSFVSGTERRTLSSSFVRARSKLVCSWRRLSTDLNRTSSFFSLWQHWGNSATSTVWRK